jgi:tetratricopeptide (TPR) repeat protein
MNGHEEGDELKRLSVEVSTLYDRGERERAVTVALRALQVAEQAVDPDHVDVATSLGDLAVLYEAQGRYVEAEPLHERALAIREEALGPDHPDVALSSTTWRR